MKRLAKPLKSARLNAAPPSKPLEPANSTAPPSSRRRSVSLRRLGVWAFRFAFLAATLGVFAVGSDVVAKAAAQTSPLVFLVALLSGAVPFPNAASGSVGVFLGVASIFSAVVFSLTLFKRRFYCRFVCPLGTAVDTAAVLRRRLFPRRFRFLRTGFVARAPRFALFFGALTLGSLALSLIFDVSFGGRTALELDPTALLSRWTLDFPTLGVLGGVFLTAFVAAPFFWRFHVCPCGALQDVCFFGLRTIFGRRRRADSATSRFDAVSPTRPTGKFRASSPDAATDKISPLPSPRDLSDATPPRRRFLRTLAVVGLAAATLGAVRRWSVQLLAAPRFRPPGALPEAAFLSRCARCGRCVAACPTQLLRFADATQLAANEKSDADDANDAFPPDDANEKIGAAPQLAATEKIADDDANDALHPDAANEKIGAAPQLAANVKVSPLCRPAPELVFADGAFCEKDCVACSLACPTGAISPLTLDAKKRFKIATVDFEIERCLIYYQQECGICRRECPFEAIDFVWNEEEYASLPVVDAAKCVGCGRCVAFCPGEPLFSELGDVAPPVDAPRPKALVLRPSPRSNR